MPEFRDGRKRLLRIAVEPLLAYPGVMRPDAREMEHFAMQARVYMWLELLGARACRYVLLNLTLHSADINMMRRAEVAQ